MEKLKAIWQTIKDQSAAIWNSCRVFIIAAVALLVALEWQKIKAALLVYAGQREINKDKVEDAGLAKQETAASNEADALVKHAESLSAQETPVDDDWNKK